MGKLLLSLSGSACFGCGSAVASKALVEIGVTLLVLMIVILLSRAKRQPRPDDGDDGDWLDEEHHPAYTAE